MKNSLIKNNNGIITLDFLFAFVLVMGFSGILFSLTMTLTVAEITQYITFASARQYSISHINEAEQRNVAYEKYQKLVSNPVFASFYNNDWFEINQQNVTIGDHADIYPEYGNQPLGINLFQGTGTKFIAKMLDFHIPFFGSTSNSDKGGGFETYIGSYLSREPTYAECWRFNNRRWEAIKQLNQNGTSQYDQAGNNNAYLAISDNGC